MVLSFGPKYERNIWQISALEFKEGSNHKIKALYNVFNTLKSPHTYLIIWKCLYVFCWFHHFSILGQEFVKFFVGILVQTITPKGHFDINWPLPNSWKRWSHNFSCKLVTLKFRFTFTLANNPRKRFYFITFFDWRKVSPEPFFISIQTLFDICFLSRQ